MNRNPTRALTVDQFNAIGRAFGESIGWLYDLYVEECFPRGKVSKRRVRPFLVQCAEIGRQDCIKPVVSKLENPTNIQILFDVAEELFYKGKQRESAYFYQLVINNEKGKRYSKRFIMSQYRLFRSLLGTDAEENGKAVIRFEPFRKRLSENFLLDALLQLANVSFTLHKWKEVEKYADELRELVIFVYNNEQNNQKTYRVFQPLKTEHHLVVYYGQGYLLKAVALEKQGQYEEAKEFVSGYADLSYFELLDEAGQGEVDKFKLCATANLYALDILMGNTSVLADYITFLEDHPTEILSSLVTIVELANKYEFSIDNLLKKFSEEIICFDNLHDPISVNRHLWFRYHLATYYFQNERYEEGIIATLRSLDLSIVTNKQKMIVQCVALFEAHRYHATDQQERDYKLALRGVMRDERLIGRSHPHSEERPTVKH